MNKTAGLAIIVLALSGWALFALNWEQKLPVGDSPELIKLREKVKRDSTTFANYKLNYALMQDSMMRLQVENGLLSVELNRKTEELLRANARYTKHRKEDQVEQALSVCDSIVYTYIPNFMYTDSMLANGYDTLHNFSKSWLVRQNSIINEAYKNIDSNSKTQIETVKTNAELKAENKANKVTEKQERKKRISWGVVGAAVGALIALVFGG